MDLLNMIRGKILVIITLTIVLIVLYIYWQVNSIIVKSYRIPVENLPASMKGFTILHFSDLHSKEFGEKQKKILKLIDELDFDIVAITGDLINKRRPVEAPIIDLIRGLQKPVFFVPGNHEWWTGFNIKEDLVNLGVQILDNKAVRIDKKGQHMWLVGVDDPYTERDDLNAAIKGIADSAPKILLAHAPNIFPTAVEHKIDLILVGHTHGGQVRMPLIGALIAPGQGLFPHWDYGLYAERKTKMVITGGLGESGLPLRFNIKPEIVLITLEPAQ